MDNEQWRLIAARQSGLITRGQLSLCGVDRWMISHRIATERWVEWSATVIGTTTGELTRHQLMWLGVLTAGRDSLIGDLTAAEIHGLERWHRDEITVLMPKSSHPPEAPPGLRMVETRRPLRDLRDPDLDLPTCRLEPAVLHFAAYQRSPRTADGALAAVVQQGLTSPGALLQWVERMRPLRWAKRFRSSLEDIAGGAQSVAEMDVQRLCRRFGLSRPQRQTKRRGGDGRIRFTDCEWRLEGGRTLVLEIDGSFHMDVESWEDDLSRQRALTGPDRLIVRCTARELRDEPESVARDLLNLGVPRAA